jgi:hypothetical protein
MKSYRLISIGLTQRSNKETIIESKSGLLKSNSGSWKLRRIPSREKLKTLLLIIRRVKSQRWKQSVEMSLSGEKSTF